MHDPAWAGLTWGGEGEAGSRGWQLAVLLGGSVARVRSFARETTSSLLSASALLPPADACGVLHTLRGASPGWLIDRCTACCQSDNGLQAQHVIHFMF